MRIHGISNLNFTVSTVLLPSGEFETMVFDPSTDDECDVVRSKTESKAKKAHEKMLAKYSAEEDVLRLVELIDNANNHAQLFADEEDGGTCNMDSLTIDLTGRSKKFIKDLIALSKFDISKIESKFWKGSYFVLLNLSGQGNRRTKMVEKANEYLKTSNIKSAVWYQMD